MRPTLGTRPRRVLRAGRCGSGPGGVRRLRGGIHLDGRPTAPAQVRVEETTPEGTWVRVTLHEGRNREVRRMLAAVGHDVRRLVRTRVGPVQLGRCSRGSTVSCAWTKCASSSPTRVLPRSTTLELGQRVKGARPRSPTGTIVTQEASSEAQSGRAETTLVIAIDGRRLGENYRWASAGEPPGRHVSRHRGPVPSAHACGPGEGHCEYRRSAPGFPCRAPRRTSSRPSVDDGRESDVRLSERDVTRAIRSKEVEADVSRVASHPAVRTALVPAHGGPHRGPPRSSSAATSAR